MVKYDTCIFCEVYPCYWTLHHNSLEMPASKPLSCLVGTPHATPYSVSEVNSAGMRKIKQCNTGAFSGTISYIVICWLNICLVTVLHRCVRKMRGQRSTTIIDTKPVECIKTPRNTKREMRSKKTCLTGLYIW